MINESWWAELHCAEESKRVEAEISADVETTRRIDEFMEDGEASAQVLYDAVSDPAIEKRFWSVLCDPDGDVRGFIREQVEKHLEGS